MIHKAVHGLKSWRQKLPDADAEAGPTRVALFMPSMASGGAERVMANIASQLAKRDDVTVDFCFVTAEGPYIDQLDEGVRIVDFGCGRIAFSLIPLIRYLRGSRPAALLSALDPPNLVAVLATKLARVNNRVVVTEHCDFSSAIEAAPRRDAAAIVPGLVRRIYPHADAIIAVSNGVADDLAASTGLDRRLIEVVGNPVITAEVREKAALEPSHPWFRDDGSLVIMAAGRLTYQKNFHLLLRASALVMDKRDARLVIFGEGPDRDDLVALAESLGISDRVDFAGFVDNPYAHMRRADAFVLSSRFEGLPTVLIEALFCGAPIVSTDCPSGPDEILDGGRYGRLVPMDDIETLSDGIIGALDGDIGQPSADSWMNFREELVVGHYLAILQGRRLDETATVPSETGRLA